MLDPINCDNWVTCAGSQSGRASKEEFGPAGAEIMTSGGMTRVEDQTTGIT